MTLGTADMDSTVSRFAVSNTGPWDGYKRQPGVRRPKLGSDARA